MKYFIDTEFLEGTQDKSIFGIKYGQTKPTIDLISIGIVAEDGREYYAISKDFNLKEAWNRFDLVNDYDVNGDLVENIKKVYWIRENVLNPIWKELSLKVYKNKGTIINGCYISAEENKLLNEKLLNDLESTLFTYKNLKLLINKYGKTKKQIAEEVKEFVYEKSFKDNKGVSIIDDKNWIDGKPEFYGYYSDYDWVVFCWLFGNMIDLPKGFPMYCVDLKQVLDERLKTYTSIELSKATCPSCKHNVYEAMDYKKPLITMQGCIKDHPNYPKQTNEHNALADARWNRDLYKFLKSL